MRVLAADDDEAMAKVLGRYLRSWGYEATIACDGAEAWRALKRDDAPPVVVLDWDMPGLSGLEVCKLLRSTPHGRDAYVLLLTARQDKHDLIEALEAGADDFLSKPFHPRELQLRLAKGISLREARMKTPSKAGAPPSGTTLGDRYRLERRVAEGGMATVWLGVHLSLGINVAIKFMKAGLADSTDYASFESEARAAAQLRNEHIVRVYDHGLTTDSSPYLVMEFVGGESLATRIEREGPFSLQETAAFVEQVARALTEAHGRGIIHRDVKPENILIDDQADHFSVKLIDFGLAKPGGPPKNDETAVVAGTPSYMSPEYLRAEVSPNALLDLWGLAATAFAAITGHLAFGGETLREIYDHVCVDPIPVPSQVNPSVPLAFDEWFARACAREPEARFQSASEFSAALVAICNALPPARARSNVASSTRLLAATEPDSTRAILTDLPLEARRD